MSKIAIFSAYYWPEYAGTAPYVTAPAEYLAAQGHEVDVYAAFAHYPEWRAQQPRRLRATEEHCGVTIHRSWHLIPRKQNAPYRAAYEASMLASGLLQLPIASRPDVIVGVSPALSSATLARAAARRFRRPYGLIVHDLFGHGAAQTGLAGGRVSGLLSRIEHGAAASAAELLVLTESFKHFFVDGGYPAERIVVAPPWTLRELPAADRSAARAELGWQDDLFVAVHAGNMGAKQGLSNIVEAANLLARSGSEIRVVLAGDGNDRANLEQLASEHQLTNISFAGGLSDREYDASLIGADALILNQRPSVSDMSMPSKLSAYLAAGRPVVGAVATGSAAALCLEASGAGPVVDPSDPQALATELTRLAGMPAAERDAIGARGIEYSKTVLSAAASLPIYEHFIEKIAAAQTA